MDLFDSLKISASALAAQKTRINVVSSNLANIETTRTPEGGPYRKRNVIFRASNVGFQGNLEQSMEDSGVQGVEVSAIRTDPAPPKMVYDPSNPDANAKGYVAMPNINLMEEMVDLMTATRAYEANVTAAKSAKQMALTALQLSK